VALLPFSGTPSPLANGENGRRQERWRPGPEDETFARRHGMNPNGVAHALRRHRQGVGGKIDESLWRDWVECHAVEAP